MAENEYRESSEHPSTTEYIVPPQEELFDSHGNKRALVNATRLRHVVINEHAYYPPHEFYYDIDNNIRGFSSPDGIYASQGGNDSKCVFWSIERSEYAAKGPYFALIKFSETEIIPEEQMHVLDGKYDRVIELPTAEGMLFFDSYIADAIVESKDLAERIQKDGLLSVRHYIGGYSPTGEDLPFMKTVEEYEKSNENKKTIL